MDMESIRMAERGDRVQRKSITSVRPAGFRCLLRVAFASTSTLVRVAFASTSILVCGLCSRAPV